MVWSSLQVVLLFALGLLALGAATLHPGAPDSAFAQTNLTPSEPLLIEGQNGTIVEDVRIFSRDGPCILIRDSTNITIRNSSIGPCRGQGIFIEGGSQITISGNQIQTQYEPRDCCDSANGILALRTRNLVVDSNAIAYSESNVQLQAVVGATITNNALANPLGPFPRGQQIQVAGGGSLPVSSDILVEDNLLIASRNDAYRYEENQEDAINLYFAEDVTVRGNQVQGGSSRSGCGILVDDGANRASILNNRLHNTAQCGVGIANGTQHIVDGNRILLDREIDGAGNTAIYTWNQYTLPCAGVSVANNIATFLREDGTHNGFWDGGGCDPVTLSNNVWDEDAYAVLRPEFVAVSDGLMPEFVPLNYPGDDSVKSYWPILLLAGGLGLLVAGVIHLRKRTLDRNRPRPRASSSG